MSKKYNEQMVEGQKFHALTYVKGTLRIEGHDTVCQWKCDCGTEITAKARDVMRGRKRSCKCYAFRKREHNVWWSGVGDMPGSYWNNVQNNAKNRNIKLSITQSEAWDLFLKQDRKCALTGVELSFDTAYNKTNGSASFDRIDSSKPYEIGNVQWVHKNINNMKKGLSEDQFIDWCRKVAQHSI